MSKAILVTEMPKNCSKCPYCDGDGWCYLQEQYIDVEENKERDFCCPLKPYKKLIPTEWIEEWGWKNGMSESMSLRVMIDDWEKENEAV